MRANNIVGLMRNQPRRPKTSRRTIKWEDQYKKEKWLAEQMTSVATFQEKSQ
jgi:Cys-tRNA synthase (O-phospho-L-seryl-tRNA:Cys-tRNA synthase)